MLRRPVGEVGLKRGYGAMTAGETQNEELCLLAVAVLFITAAGADNPEEADQVNMAGALIAAALADERIDRTVVKSVTGRPLRIADVCEEDAWNDYRFRRGDIRQLLTVLHFPDVWVCKNKSRFPGETALLLLLRRLRYPARLSDLEQDFQREYSQLSRLFREVIDFIFEEHGHLINDNLGYWEPMFETMAKVVENKGGVGCDGSNIFGFLDGTLRRTCRQQGHDDIQRENYDGHHRSLGLAFQSLVLPNGMIGDMYGPAPGRRYDSYLLRKSNLNDRLAALQAGKAFQGKVYGDAAYPVLSHVDRGFRGANLTVAQRAYNKELSRVRISVEWQFGKILQVCPFVDFKRSQKLMLSPVGKYYTIAALLTNAHTTCYGCGTSKYFDMIPPTLEEYFHP